MKTTTASPAEEDAPAPLALGFDCATAACSVAVARGGVTLAARREALVHGHAAILPPMIDSVLREAGLDYPALELLAVTVGPGSFTGIRIALAAARGLALALDLPLAGRTTFEALADALSPASRAWLDARGATLLAAVDSRRAEIFLAGYDAMLRPAIAARAATPQVLAAELPPGAYLLAGDAAETLRAALLAAGHDPARLALAPEAAQPEARHFVPAIATRGAAAWRRHNAKHGLPRPLYLRPPDVTLPAVGARHSSVA